MNKVRSLDESRTLLALIWCQIRLNLNGTRNKYVRELDLLIDYIYITWHEKNILFVNTKLCCIQVHMTILIMCIHKYMCDWYMYAQRSNKFYILTTLKIWIFDICVCVYKDNKLIWTELEQVGLVGVWLVINSSSISNSSSTRLL